MSIDLRPHMAILGFKVQDKVTGLVGVVTSLSFDLYGCVQAIVHPGLDKATGKPAEQHWFDVSRLQVQSRKPVIPVPDFNYEAGAAHGPAEKPRQFKA